MLVFKSKLHLFTLFSILVLSSLTYADYDKSGGNIAVKADNQVIAKIEVNIQQGFTSETVEALTKSKVTEVALQSFLAVLDRKHIPAHERPTKLVEIAKNYQTLKQQMGKIKSDNEAVTQLVTQTNQAIGQGDFKQARKYLDQAEVKAQSEATNQAFIIIQAEILATKGALANTEIKYLEAAKAYEKASKKLDVLDNPDYKDLTDYLARAAQAYYDQKLFPLALPLLQQGLQLREKHLPNEPILIATSLNNLAVLYRVQRMDEKAEQLYLRGLAILEKALGKEHPDIAATLNNLAVLYQEQSKYKEAGLLYKRVLAIREKVLGKEHSSVGTVLDDLAGIYVQQRKYEEAEPLYRRALAISEKALGKEHPSVATALNNLAGLYEDQGKYKEAGPLYKRSLTILEKTLGKEHPSVATALNNSAVLYQAQEKYKEAEILYLRSLTMREKALGKEHPDVARSLNNLAVFYYTLKKYKEALPLAERALTIWRDELGEDHHDTKIAQETIDAIKDKLNHQVGKATINTI